MDIDLTDVLKQKMKPRARVRGRYNSSEIYAILVGFRGHKMTPAEWMKSEPKEVKDLLNMWNGTGIHNQLEDLMGKEHSEKKIEYKYTGLTLVAKVDFMPPHKPDHIWEFKSSEKTMDKAKPWAEHQVKLYTSIFEKKFGSIYQPVQSPEGLFLKHLATVNRDDVWFMEQMEALYQFHLEVEKLWQ